MRYNGWVKICLKNIPWPVWALLAAALLIRAFNLPDIILYWDEPIHSVRIDAQPLPFVLAHNNASALFAILVHALLPLGKIELMARLPSFLFGSLLVLLIYYAGRTFFTRREGIVAAALVTFSPFLIRFSQYSRGYSVFVFFTLLALLLFHRAREAGRWALWAGYAGAALAAMHAHLMGFMAMTGLSLYAAGEWASAMIFWSRERRAATRRLLLFGVFSFIAVAGAVLLYLPDENVQGFLHSSVDRAAGRLPFSFLAPHLLKMILTTQWQASAWGLALWLGAAGIGLFLALIRRPRTALLFTLYALMPFLIFIRINPRQVNIQSAERYFIFVLPVLLLLAARGITAAADALSRGFSAFFNKAGRLRQPAASLLTAALTLTILAGADLRHYYLNFHRFNTLPVPGEVLDCMKANAGSDALLLYDRFPAPGLRLMINPLTRDPRFQSSEAELRGGLQGAQGSRIMIFRSITDPRESYTGPFGLWVVTERTPAKTRLAEAAVADRPDVRLFPLEKNLVLHFLPGSSPLGARVIEACTLLLETGPGPDRRREWLLLRARARLILGRIPAGFSDLDAARAVPAPTGRALDHETPGAFRILDRLFGLDADEIMHSYHEYFFYRDTAEVLFASGEKALERGDRDTALSAFREAPLWSSHLDRTLSNRIGRIAAARLREEGFQAAAGLYAEAGRLDPARPALPCLEAEALRAAGFESEAREKWRSALGWDEAPPSVLDRLVSQHPLMVLKRRQDGWLICLRAPRRATFSGRVTADKTIEGASGDLFAAEDSIDHNRSLLEFTVESRAGRLKTIFIRTRDRAGLTFDLKLDGRRTPNSVVIVDGVPFPDRIPFTLK